MKKQKFETRHRTGIIEVEGYPKTYEGIDYFIYKLGTWQSVEKSTGLGIASGFTIKDCEKETESKIDGAKSYILNIIEKYKKENKQINN